MIELKHREGSDARVLAIVAAGTLLTLVAFTTVIPTVQDTAVDLDAGPAGQTWALSSMSLGLAGALLTLGSVADLVGHRRVFILAVLGLGLAAGLAAAAPTMTTFVIARVLQGVAGAGVLAAGLGLLGRHFQAGPERTRATGLWGASLGAGIALGPVVAAALSDAVDGRAASALTLAGGFMVAVTALRLPRPPDTGASAATRARVDWIGASLAILAMGGLTAGLTEGRSDWTSATTLGLLAGGLIALAAFGVAERRTAHPMLDLGHLREATFQASVGGAAVTGLATIGLLSSMPLVLQRGLGLTALATGAILAFWSATSTVVAAQVRRLPETLGSAERLVAGLLATGAGLAGLAVLDSDASWWVFVPGLVVAGVGSGVTNAALGRLAVESVPPAEAAIGSGANNTARYLGAALGIAIVVAIISGAGSSPDGLATGWNRAALLCGALNLAGAALATTLVARRRRATAAAPERSS